jgi:DNA repair protein RecO
MSIRRGAGAPLDAGGTAHRVGGASGQLENPHRVNEIIKTEAIALRWHEVTNTSRIVQWLTPRHGRIATLIKGAQRPRSAFLGQYDHFYTCELLFYARENDGLHIARECCPLDPRSGLRTRWRACTAASHAGGLLLRALPRQAPAPEVFTWYGELLDDLAERDFHYAALVWFELHLLERLGVAPRLDSCGLCGEPITGREPGLRFSEADGGLLHGPCVGDNASTPVSAPALAILRACRRASHAAQIRTLACNPGQRKEINLLLGRFHAYHLDLDPLPRQLAMELLERPQIAAG